jgi:chemotaxis signal transduction protein
LERLPHRTGNFGKIIVFIDGMWVVAENGYEGSDMSVQEYDPPASATPSVLKVLIATIGGRYLGVEAGFVTGVLTMEELECGNDPAMQGVVDRTDELMMEFKMTDVPTHAHTPVVLLTSRGVRCTIRVNHVHGLLEIQPSQVLPLPAQFINVERHWYRGMILFEKSVAMILNPTWLIGEPVGNTSGAALEAPRSLPDARGLAIQDGQAC